MYHVRRGVEGCMFQLCNLSNHVNLSEKGKEKKYELHIVITYRTNRIKIFYILEFASFCKKRKEKEI